MSLFMNILGMEGYYNKVCNLYPCVRLTFCVVRYYASRCSVVICWYMCTYSDGDWDFYWCDREWLHQNYDTMFLYEHQKILHFRNHYEVTQLIKKSFNLHYVLMFEYYPPPRIFSYKPLFSYCGPTLPFGAIIWTELNLHYPGILAY